MLMKLCSFAGLVTLLGTPCVMLAQSPYASTMVSYTSGLVTNPLYTASPHAALGAPERMTGEFFGADSVVTPFNPAFGPDELIAVGGGGSLVLGFEQPIVNDPANPFGLDLIVFGNAGFADVNYPAGTTSPDAAMFGVGAPASVFVSADGVDWRPLVGSVDTLFPTLGYIDVLDPYALLPGDVAADFRLPVDPDFQAADLSFAALVAGYAGSGGGTGFDIGPTGLSSISFIKFENHATFASAFEIDAVSDVAAIPAPASVLALTSLLLAGARRRARHEY